VAVRLVLGTGLITIRLITSSRSASPVTPVLSVTCALKANAPATCRCTHQTARRVQAGARWESAADQEAGNHLPPPIGRLAAGRLQGRRVGVLNHAFRQGKRDDARRFGQSKPPNSRPRPPSNAPNAWPSDCDS
jgi:hypothetical protein